MKILGIVLLMGVSLTLNANDTKSIDQQLAQYIKTFQMKALEWPAESSEGEVKLGRNLFFEKALSGNYNMSCASCHAENEGLGDNLPLSIGQGMTFNGNTRVKGDAPLIPRNTPHLFNIGFDEQIFMFWDGRVHYSEKDDVFTTPNPHLNGKEPQAPGIKRAMTHANTAQALFPMLSHDEMLGLPEENEIASLSSDQEIWQALLDRLLYGAQASFYQKLFRDAYPDTAISELTIGHVAEAIYAFEKHAFVINDTPWDRYLRGDNKALSPQEKKGALVFMEKGRCAECHNGPHLSNFDFKNTAVPPIGPGKTKSGQDYGRFHATGKVEDKFKFKVPALRNVALTAPYMHNGAFINLKEVINHYDHVRHSFMHYTTANINHRYRYTYGVDLERVFIKKEVIDMFKGLDQNMWPPILFTNDEKEDLLAFLKKSLTQLTPTFYRPWVKK